jgi:hypothetical protein
MEVSMNSNLQGNIGEASVMLEAIKRGYAVSVPHGHSTRYDLIIDKCGRLYRVQVKTIKSDGCVASILT